MTSDCAQLLWFRIAFEVSLKSDTRYLPSLALNAEGLENFIGSGRFEIAFWERRVKPGTQLGSSKSSGSFSLLWGRLASSHRPRPRPRQRKSRFPCCSRTYFASSVQKTSKGLFRSARSGKSSLLTWPKPMKANTLSTVFVVFCVQNCAIPSWNWIASPELSRFRKLSKVAMDNRWSLATYSIKVAGSSQRTSPASAPMKSPSGSARPKERKYSPDYSKAVFCKQNFLINPASGPPESHKKVAHKCCLGLTRYFKKPEICNNHITAVPLFTEPE
jgi:hypothetical protein